MKKKEKSWIYLPLCTQVGLHGLILLCGQQLWLGVDKFSYLLSFMIRKKFTVFLLLIRPHLINLFKNKKCIYFVNLFCVLFSCPRCNETILFKFVTTLAVTVLNIKLTKLLLCLSANLRKNAAVNCAKLNHCILVHSTAVSYTHLDVYKRQLQSTTE